MLRPELQKVFSYLGDKICKSIIIAGGAAADFDKANDVDLWFGNDRKDLAEEYLRKFPFFLLNETAVGYNSHRIIGNGFDPAIGKIVQVLIYPQDNWADLIASFDISTHCAAILSRGQEYHFGVTFTHPTLPPKVLKSTPQTLTRYVKICQRYGHPIDPEQLTTACTVKAKAPTLSDIDKMIAANEIEKLAKLKNLQQLASFFNNKLNAL